MQQSLSITILLSVHNGADTLDRCLESIFDQTFQQFHIICVDDHSTDQTPQIFEQWQKVVGPERFHILVNDRVLGLTVSLNRGLKTIKTQYTARIDADDWWDRTKLEKQMKFLEQSPGYGVIGTAYSNISSTGKKDVFPPADDGKIKKSMFRRNPFAHSSVVFDTELIRQHGGYDSKLRYGQDYELWLRISSFTKFANLTEVLCYREAGSELSISYQKQSEQMWQCVKTQYRYLRLFHRPLREYIYMFDPLIALITPSPIRRLKRKWL